MKLVESMNRKNEPEIARKSNMTRDNSYFSLKWKETVRFRGRQTLQKTPLCSGIMFI